MSDRIIRETPESLRRGIADALAAIHVPITEAELAERVEAGEACEHELAAWDRVETYRWLLGEEE